MRISSSPDNARNQMKLVQNSSLGPGMCKMYFFFFGAQIEVDVSRCGLAIARLIWPRRRQKFKPKCKPVRPAVVPQS